MPGLCEVDRGTEMIALFKAIPLSALLTLVLALFIGAGGASGGPFEVFGFSVDGYRLYWSWVLFSAGTGLVWALMLLMGD